MQQNIECIQPNGGPLVFDRRIMMLDQLEQSFQGRQHGAKVVADHRAVYAQASRMMRSSKLCGSISEASQRRSASCTATANSCSRTARTARTGPYHRRVSLHLYDTATRSVRPFEPLRPGVVSLYNCGATVQWHPHIGHLRGAGVVYDVLRRWLEFSGYEVLHVRNVTDIDDKILTKAAEAGRPWWEWATTHERSFYDAYDALGCLRPSIEPRATGHIPQIIEMISELIDSGHAYAAAGDVYFAVRTQPDYGFLSGQRIDEMVQEAPCDHRQKSHADIAWPPCATAWPNARRICAPHTMRPIPRRVRLAGRQRLRLCLSAQD